MKVYVWSYMYSSADAQSPDEGIKSPQDGVTGSYELLDMGAGN